jgi:2-iminobutanoate/2-iminopropanoate deaminase
VKQIIIFVFVFILSSCESIETKKVISTDKAPQAIGPYSQAIQVKNTLYLAGQIALDPVTGKMLEGNIEVQTHRVMKNLRAVLLKAGFSFNDVVQSQVFLSDINNYKPMNAIYAKYFSDKPPARAVVEVARIPRDALVEIMLVAQKP